MKKFMLILLALQIPMMVGGCARYVVIKNPTDATNGIRYYRPKPYLYVGPPKATGMLGQAVIQVEYLPDYEEEYAIQVSPGLGTTNLDVTLADGWNLTSLKGQTDQKYAEIIGSLGSLASGAANLAKAQTAAPHAIPPLNANAVDAPYGYYESVFWTDQCGKKHLYGWRYIGFLPFSGCPVQACPTIHDAHCDDPDQFWALIAGGGGLKFVKISELREQKALKPQPTPTPDAPPDGSVSHSKPWSAPDSTEGESQDKKQSGRTWIAPTNSQAVGSE